MLRFAKTGDGKYDLEFQCGDQVVIRSADIVVGADGIRSQVRQQIVGDDKTPLRYLGCIVILGICSLDLIAPSARHSPLLDGETVFQTADGTTRIYMMPFTESEYMWQLSFPMREGDAAALSSQGAAALRVEAMQRCSSWHTPVSEILNGTPDSCVSGYPVYDRELLSADQFRDNVTLIGDACHPMSPFKGQGANQALLDALYLARALYSTKGGKSSLEKALGMFHEDMMERTSVKVLASAEAARFLHTDVAIQSGNVTRGAAASGAS